MTTPNIYTSAPIDGGELLTVQKAAEILGVSPGTVHRWLLDGFIAGEQIHCMIKKVAHTYTWGGGGS